MHNHRDYAKNIYWTEYVSGGDQLTMLAIYGTDAGCKEDDTGEGCKQSDRKAQGEIDGVHQCLHSMKGNKIMIRIIVGHPTEGYLRIWRTSRQRRAPHAQDEH